VLRENDSDRSLDKEAQNIHGILKQHIDGVGDNIYTRKKKVI
jgi:hypothetical protein